MPLNLDFSSLMSEDFYQRSNQEVPPRPHTFPPRKSLETPVYNSFADNNFLDDELFYQPILYFNPRLNFSKESSPPNMSKTLPQTPSRTVLKIPLQTMPDSTIDYATDYTADYAKDSTIDSTIDSTRLCQTPPETMLQTMPKTLPEADSFRIPMSFSDPPLNSLKESQTEIIKPDKSADENLSMFEKFNNLKIEKNSAKLTLEFYKKRMKKSASSLKNAPWIKSTDFKKYKKRTLSKKLVDWKKFKIPKIHHFCDVLILHPDDEEREYVYGTATPPWIKT